jgi:hypothetical protein
MVSSVTGTGPVIDGGGNDPGVAATLDSGLWGTTDIQGQIKMILALKKGDADLEAAWTAYINRDMDAFRAAVLRSKFYTSNNALARERAQTKASQGPVYEQQLADYKSSTRKRLTGIGVKITPAIEAILTTAYDGGMSDNALNDLLISSGNIDKLGGSTLGTVNSLKQFADEFGIKKNDTYWNDVAKNMFSGTITTEDIQKEIKDLSMSTYPAYADGIAKGRSLSAMGSHVIDSVSRYLERDPNTVTFDDPLVKKIMQYVDPKTGQPAQMPGWAVDKMVKSDASWLDTKNARDTVDSLSMKVFKDWGLA